MMQVINRSGFAPNIWSNLHPLPLSSYSGGPALLMAVDDDPTDIAPYFDMLKLILVPFSSNADGRGFSLASQLRVLGFTGHIRAHGHILVDQFYAALRCGFDDVEISDSQAKRNPEHQWKAVPFDANYQSQIFLRQTR